MEWTEETRGKTLVVLEGNCDGCGAEYRDWLHENYPELTVDYRENVSGIGGGLFDEDGNDAGGTIRIDNLLWDEYCNNA